MLPLSNGLALLACLCLCGRVWRTRGSTGGCHHRVGGCCTGAVTHMFVCVLFVLKMLNPLAVLPSAVAVIDV